MVSIFEENPNLKRRVYLKKNREVCFIDFPEFQKRVFILFLKKIRPNVGEVFNRGGGNNNSPVWFSKTVAPASKQDIDLLIALNPTVSLELLHSH